MIIYSEYIIATFMKALGVNSQEDSDSCSSYYKTHFNSIKIKLMILM